MELTALETNNTWAMVPCPSGFTPIGCKWVYTIKYHADGSIDRYKVRLVALGNYQEEGVDYEETLAHVAKMTTFRILFTVASSKNWYLLQIDVKNAFLHGELHEEVYMKPPPGLLHTSFGSVCRLHKSIYGLKQAPRAWFDKFCNTLLTGGFRHSKYDPSLFLKHTPVGIIILLVYMDDILITGNDVVGITSLQSFLQKSFCMKDLGPVTYFLGIEVHRCSKGIYLSQKKYIDDLVSQAHLIDDKEIATPLELNVKLTKDSGQPL